MTRPRVTAGLMWHPDTWPRVWARLATVIPKQSAILTMFAWSENSVEMFDHFSCLIIELRGGLGLVPGHAAAAPNHNQQQAPHQLSQEGPQQQT